MNLGRAASDCDTRLIVRPWPQPVARRRSALGTGRRRTSFALRARRTTMARQHRARGLRISWCGGGTAEGKRIEACRRYGDHAAVVAEAMAERDRCRVVGQGEPGRKPSRGVHLKRARRYRGRSPRPTDSWNAWKHRPHLRCSIRRLDRRTQGRSRSGRSAPSGGAITRFTSQARTGQTAREGCREADDVVLAALKGDPALKGTPGPREHLLCGL